MSHDKKHLLAFFLFVLFCGLAAPGFAAPAAEPTSAPPDAAATGEGLEPEITIIHRGGEMIEEYRINGRLYMIKITPRKGVPYFLVDADGDGDFEIRQNELDEELRIPQWTILRW